MSVPGFRPIKLNDTSQPSPDNVERLPEKAIDAEVNTVEKQETVMPKNNPEEKRPGFRPIDLNAAPGQKKQVGIFERIGRGGQRSVFGEAQQLISGEKPIDTTNEEEPGFFGKLSEEFGTALADAPVYAGSIAAGTAATGNPITGTAIGFALPAFLKESMKQYRQFQEGGGDLTYGEFLERSGNVLGASLKEGVLGAAFGTVQKLLPVLYSVPGVKDVLNTKYLGKPLKAATTITAEAGTLTTIPAVLEGRLPETEDFARAAVLFTGFKGASSAPQLGSVIKNQINAWTQGYQVGEFNFALAKQIESQNLAYPPIQELMGKTDTVYKNSVALDNNIAQFSESYINAFKNKVDALSPTQFQSSDQAGRTILDVLGGTTFETSPPPGTASVASQNIPILEKPVGKEISVSEAPDTSETIKTLQAGQQAFPTPEQPQQVTPAAPTVKKPAIRQVHIVENPLNTAVEGISQQTFRSSADAGRKITEAYQANRAEDYAPFKERFNDMQENTRNIEFLDEVFPAEIEAFIDEFSPQAIPGSQAGLIVTRANELLDLFVAKDEKGEPSGYKDVNMRKLIQRNRALKQIPNWDVPPEMRDNISRLTNATDVFILDKLNEFDPDIAEDYGQLNADYHNFKSRYDNNDMRIFYDRTENSEAVYKRFSNLDEFTQLTEALNTSLEGRNVLDAMRRDKLTKTLGDTLTATTEGEFSDRYYKFGDRDFQNMMEFLEPQQQGRFTQSLNQSNRIRQAALNAELEYQVALEDYEAAKVREKEASKKSQREKQAAQKEAKRLKTIEMQKKSQAAQQRRNLKSKDIRKIANKVDTQQDLLVSLLSNDPAALTNNMHSIEGIRRMKEACKKAPQGKELYDSLARYETEEMFSFIKDDFITTGKVPYTKIKKALQTRDFRAKLVELNGEAFVKDLDSLVNTADSLSKQYKEMVVQYKDDPNTLNSFMNIAIALGIQGSGITSMVGAIPQLAAKKPLLAGVKKVGTWWNNRNNYTQENIRTVLEGAKALKSGNKKQINRIGKLLSPASIRNENANNEVEDKRKKK